MKYLGIDYGEKRVGIAISDENGEMAFPRVVLTNDSKLIEKIVELVSENGVQKIILGESKNLNLEDNEIMTDILELKSILEKVYEKDVVLHNEMYSSAMAEREQGKNAMLDASAAAIILQSYIDLQKNKNK